MIATEIDDSADSSESDVENVKESEIRENYANVDNPVEEKECEEESGGSDGDDESGGQGEMGNAGWADAMRKILKTGRKERSKTVVLSKAKKLSAIKREKEEVENKEIKEEDTHIKKLECIIKSRTKPNILNQGRERYLAKIATKGIVQLFNAVNTHRKTLAERGEIDDLKPKKRKKFEAIDKMSFLKVLTNDPSNLKISDDVKPEIKSEDENEDEQSWKVLKDNFMLGTKLRNWDQAVDEVETFD